MERWDRAKQFGLNPPEEVRDMVLTHHADDAYTHWLVLFTSNFIFKYIYDQHRQ